MRGDTFFFDGRLMSQSEIARALEMAPITVRKHFAAGRHTRQEIMAYEPARARKAGGKRGSRTMKRIIETQARDHQDKKASGR